MLSNFIKIRTESKLFHNYCKFAPGSKNVRKAEYYVSLYSYSSTWVCARISRTYLETFHKLESRKYYLDMAIVISVHLRHFDIMLSSFFCE